jgi:predicted nucleic acid-binding Zn ribbon protein
VTAQPAPHPRCAACGAVVTPDAGRCAECGLARPARGARHLLARTALWALAAFLLFAWVAALAIVAAAR